MSASAIGAYMFLNKEGVINPKIVLVTIAFINSMRDELITFPLAISDFVKALVSLKRIRSFLEADEVSRSPEDKNSVVGPNYSTAYEPFLDKILS